MSDDRELRDALERAQARTRLLERLLAEECEDREALADQMLALRQALDDAEQRVLPAPGEMREVVRLKAQLHAQQLTISHLNARVAELERK
jgi:predicted RNase H-like nuclease (RuvC/YqgF family)